MGKEEAVDDTTNKLPPIITAANDSGADVTADAELAKTPEAKLKTPQNFGVVKSPSFVYNEQMAGTSRASMA